MENRETLLLELLDNENSALKEIYLASFALDRISPALMQKVLAMAKSDPDEGVRVAAVKLLGRFWSRPESRDTDSFDHLRATSQLRQIYQQSDQFRTKAAILLALDRRPFPAVKDFFLTVALVDRDEYLRAMTVTLLSRKDDTAVCPAVEDALRDADARVRANAVEALGRFRHRYGEQVFLGTLHDANHRVQIASLKVLLRLGWHGIDGHLEAMAGSASRLFRDSARYFARSVAEA